MKTGAINWISSFHMCKLISITCMIGLVIVSNVLASTNKNNNNKKKHLSSEQESFNRFQLKANKHHTNSYHYYTKSGDLSGQHIKQSHLYNPSYPAINTIEWEGGDRWTNDGSQQTTDALGPMDHSLHQGNPIHV